MSGDKGLVPDPKNTRMCLWYDGGVGITIMFMISSRLTSQDFVYLAKIG